MHGIAYFIGNSRQESDVTTDYPPGTTPTGPANVPPNREGPGDGAWGCFWWWWLVIIIIILILWWAGWGWGPSGGYWFRNRTVPQTAPPTNRTMTTPATRPAAPENAPVAAPATRPSGGGAAAPAGPGTPAVALNWSGQGVETASAMSDVPVF